GRGDAWFPPPGSGLYVSIVLVPGRARVDPRRATTLLTIAVGVALAEGIQQATGLATDLKWPNDVYVGRRKLAGILAEAPAAGTGLEAVVPGDAPDHPATPDPPRHRALPQAPLPALH